MRNFTQKTLGLFSQISNNKLSEFNQLYFIMKFSQSAIIKPQFFNFICAYVLNIETSLTSFSFDRQLPSLTWASENKTLASKKKK